MVEEKVDLAKTSPKNIAIIHPDLGIGGAERLIVDIALGLKELGHNVTVYTSHCDKSHAFEEVSSGKLKVIVYGDSLPRKIFGKFTILCAIVRQIYLVCKLLWLSNSAFDFYIVDSLASCLPIIWFYNVLFKSWKTYSRVFFYCHFPDLRLSQNSTIIKRLYRVPFDYYEQTCYLFPTKIYVNSYFTRYIFNSTFPLLNEYDFFTQPSVLYPCIDENVQLNPDVDKLIKKKFSKNQYFLSVNRFERKKNIELAVESFSEFLKINPNSKEKLIVAGGYDTLVSENVEYLKELCNLVDDTKLKWRVIMDYKEFINLETVEESDIYFIPNISTELKNSLIKNTEMLLYTPSFEHFGIVPIEAMKYNTLVLAVNNGGPRETIIPLDADYNNEKDTISISDFEGTGFLKPQDSKCWCNVMMTVLNMSKEDREKISRNGERVIQKLFTRKVLREAINKDIDRFSDPRYLKRFLKVRLNTLILFVTVGSPILIMLSVVISLL